MTPDEVAVAGPVVDVDFSDTPETIEIRMKLAATLEQIKQREAALDKREARLLAQEQMLVRILSGALASTFNINPTLSNTQNG